MISEYQEVTNELIGIIIKINEAFRTAPVSFITKSCLFEFQKSHPENGSKFLRCISL